MLRRPDIDTLYRDGRNWKTSIAIFLLLIGPLYVLPSVIRWLLLAHLNWWFGVLFADIFGALTVGYLTNNQRFGAGLYLVCTAAEALAVTLGHDPAVALWIGDLFPALVAIYFAQKLYTNMGD